MNNDLRRLFIAGWLILLGSALASCGVGPSEPGRYYVLSSLPDLVEQASAPKGGKRLTIGVGPVLLPAHLDRTQIVTLASRHRLDINDLDQWAEPLKDGFTRVLVQNLSSLLATDHIFQFPWRRPVTVDFQVNLQVAQFDTNAQGQSTLSTRWNIFKGDGRELLYSQKSNFTYRSSSQEIESVVVAMSGNLMQLSREIAASISAFRNN